MKIRLIQFFTYSET